MSIANTVAARCVCNLKDDDIGGIDDERPLQSLRAPCAC